MNSDLIQEIRILPSDTKTYKSENDFRNFVTKIMIDRGGFYFFPNSMMNCSQNTLVLFQYNGKIRATGILIDRGRKEVIDETGIKYNGYYKFDINSLHYLETPIDKNMLQSIIPKFHSFNQSKQLIDIEYLDKIFMMLQNVDGFYFKETKENIKIIEDIDKNLDELEGKIKETIVKTRINQSVFRELLLKRYNNKCCLCGVNNEKLLIASHIKPWAVSEPAEKLDKNNGFLLCPNHDVLFDGGYITVNNDGCILISDEIDEINRIFLNVRSNMKIDINEDNKEYLQYHRDNIFKKNMN